MPLMTRRQLLGTTAAAVLIADAGNRANAQQDGRALRFLSDGAPNSLDPTMIGATQDTSMLGLCTYDRLFAFGSKPSPSGDGTAELDFSQIRGEIADGFDVSADGLVITIRLKREAVFHDGRPITAEDVKWSLDRAVTAAVSSKAQLATGSLTSSDQFKIIDEKTVQIRLERPDQLALPNLATFLAPIFNSKLVREKAAADDPWGIKWLQTNTAGSGAYIIESFVQGQRVILRRNDKWAGGQADFARVVFQTVPEAATRANLIGHGDADVAINLLAEDFSSLKDSGKIKGVSKPLPTAFVALVLNTRMPPFDNKLVRQAIARAVPYDDVLNLANAGRGKKLYGASWTSGPQLTDFPQPLPNRTDIEQAKVLLAKAGYPKGFKTTLSYGVNRGYFADVSSALIQEALGRIGITVEIDRKPDAQMAEAITAKNMPMFLERAYAFFPRTEYFFRIYFSGASRWNLANWNNSEIAKILPEARYEADKGTYERQARQLVSIMADETPMVLLWQPTIDVAMARSVSGFTSWYHPYVDVRNLKRVSAP